MGNRSRRSSPLSRARPEPADTHPPRDIPRPPKSPSPRGASPSPKQYPRPAPSPARSDLERRSVETAGRQHHAVEPEIPIKVEEQPVEGAIIMEGQTEVEMTTEPPIKGEDRSDQPDEELHGKAELIRRTSSPTECQQQQSLPTHETVAVPSSEVAVTQPYLPTIPRYDAKPRFSAAYESEYSRVEAHRAHAAAECRRCFKASRRAFHELEMATLDLRAAQHRRELAESHRKKAHHGQLGIDAESMVNK
ncbi:hypothetical protein L210DRAFT_968844 [Boletus edulis BED1]|uniref:Uncharacterized protein n=1 Tax=Boletus edulis BED1 TaxID=1328754 RepID=A0AAD4BQI9_BOLED|nr:hypothetical protein L210DRAFT_968844 [Boletus edulis BED1]